MIRKGRRKQHHAMPCIKQYISEEAFLVLLGHLQQQGNMPLPCVDSETHDQADQALRQFATALGMPWQKAESMLPGLEQAIACLKKAKFPTADEEAAI